MRRSGSRDDAHDRAGQDLAGTGGGAEPCRFDHRRAVEIAVLVAAVTEAQPDADLQGVGRVAVALVHALLDRHRARETVGRAEERGHRAVAHRLDEGAPVGVDEPPDQVVVLTLERVSGVVADTRSQGGGVHEVGEHDRVGRARSPFHRPKRR